MKEINLSFNEEQFKALQKLIYLGKWMLESHHDDFIERFKIEKEAEQIVLANSDHRVSEFSKKFNMFFPTKDFEDEMHLYIEEYDQYTFWDELTNQLAERDARVELGDQFEKMDLLEKIGKLDEYVEIYTEEFMKNDLMNLKIR